MQMAGQEGELFATPFGPGGGHHSILVVIKGAMDRSDKPGLMQIVVQLLLGGARCRIQIRALKVHAINN